MSCCAVGIAGRRAGRRAPRFGDVGAGLYRLMGSPSIALGECVASPCADLEKSQRPATKNGDRPRRLPPRARPLRHRCHHRHHLRRRRPADRAHRQRVHVGLARPAADPGLRRPQVAELPGAARPRAGSRSTSWATTRSTCRAASPTTSAGEVRGRRRTASSALGLPLLDGRPGPARVHHRARLPWRRPHDLRRPGRGRARVRRRASRCSTTAGSISDWRRLLTGA